MGENLLEVRNLVVEYGSGKQAFRAVDEGLRSRLEGAGLGVG